MMNKQSGLQYTEQTALDMIRYHLMKGFNGASTILRICRDQLKILLDSDGGQKPMNRGSFWHLHMSSWPFVTKAMDFYLVSLLWLMGVTTVFSILVPFFVILLVEKLLILPMRICHRIFTKR